MTTEGYCPRCMIVRLLSSAPDCRVCTGSLSPLPDDWPVRYRETGRTNDPHRCVQCKVRVQVVDVKGRLRTLDPDTGDTHRCSVGVTA